MNVPEGILASPPTDTTNHQYDNLLCLDPRSCLILLILAADFGSIISHYRAICSVVFIIMCLVYGSP
jgi:hypothetical protein